MTVRLSKTAIGFRPRSHTASMIVSVELGGFLTALLPIVIRIMSPLHIIGFHRTSRQRSAKISDAFFMVTYFRSSIPPMCPEGEINSLFPLNERRSYPYGGLIGGLLVLVVGKRVGTIHGLRSTMR